MHILLDTLTHVSKKKKKYNMYTNNQNYKVRLFQENVCSSLNLDKQWGLALEMLCVDTGWCMYVIHQMRSVKNLKWCLSDVSKISNFSKRTGTSGSPFLRCLMNVSWKRVATFTTVAQGHDSLPSWLSFVISARRSVVGISLVPLDVYYANSVWEPDRLITV